jgi:hypothetical protein
MTITRTIRTHPLDYLTEPEGYDSPSYQFDSYDLVPSRGLVFDDMVCAI